MGGQDWVDVPLPGLESWPPEGDSGTSISRTAKFHLRVLSVHTTVFPCQCSRGTLESMKLWCHISDKRRWRVLSGIFTQFVCSSGVVCGPWLDRVRAILAYSGLRTINGWPIIAGLHCRSIPPSLSVPYISSTGVGPSCYARWSEGRGISLFRGGATQKGDWVWPGN